jgi:DGQHR domain-containing protein
MGAKTTSAQGFLLQEDPQIVCAKLPGDWLLTHTTPSWRIVDPIAGFQRMVREQRAKQIAVAVLDQQRTFPNAIVLATDVDSIEAKNGNVTIPEETRFLIVDGQHRLWAQRFSAFTAPYSCLIHTGLSQEGMANLFLEINDNQKRVPASLRWDLVRLIQPVDDPQRLAAAEIVYLLATEEDSPFYQRIDLTGEQSELLLKQASLAPEFRSLLRSRGPLAGVSFLEQHRVILEYSLAIQQIDADRWGTAESPFYKARVLRSLFRLLSDLIAEIGDPKLPSIRAMDFIQYLKRIDEQHLNPEHIRSMQGSAGMTAIYRQIKGQVLPT